MKKPKNRVITLILLLAFILWPCSAHNAEAEVITASGIILAAKIISWTATGLDAAKTTAEIVYQQLVSAESMRLYKQRLNDLDIDLDELKLKIIATGPKQVEKLRKLLLKREFILQEKIGLGTLVRAIEENRDTIVKKKFMKGIASVAKGYAVGELVSTVGGDMVGAVHTLLDTVSKMPADLKEAYLEKKISKEDKEYYDTLGAESTLTRLRVAMLEAEFDKYINEVVKPAFERYMTTGKDDLYSELPPEIRKLVRGQYEVKVAERLRKREKQLEEYRTMHLEALKKQQEDMRKKQEMAQKRLGVLQNNPEVVKGFKKIVAKKPVGDDDKLAQYIASVALASAKIVAEGAKIPSKQKSEVITEEDSGLMPERKLSKKEPDIETLCNLYREKIRKSAGSKLVGVYNVLYEAELIFYECSKIDSSKYPERYQACHRRGEARMEAWLQRIYKAQDDISNDYYTQSREIYKQRDKFLLSVGLSTASPLEEVEQYLKQFQDESDRAMLKMRKLSEQLGDYRVSLIRTVGASGDSPAGKEILAKIVQTATEMHSFGIEVVITMIKLETIKELRKKIEESNKK